MTQPPAGWHPDPHAPGQQRYWDGLTWTDHVAPAVAPTPPPAGYGQPQFQQKAYAPKSKKPFWKTWWFITIGVLVVLVIIGSAAGSGNGGNTTDNTASAADTTGGSPTSEPSTPDAGTPTPTPTPDATTPAPPPAQPTPTYTLSQQNVIQAAQDYLSTSAFSRAGLIDQLSSSAGDGYSRALAVFAVSHIKVNWYKQAVQSAKDYLSTSSFSRSGLIEQLSSSAGDQYTRDQATYAANQVGLR